MGRISAQAFHPRKLRFDLLHGQLAVRQMLKQRTKFTLIIRTAYEDRKLIGSPLHRRPADLTLILHSPLSLLFTAKPASPRFTQSLTRIRFPTAGFILRSSDASFYSFRTHRAIKGPLRYPPPLGTRRFRTFQTRYPKETASGY